MLLTAVWGALEVGVKERNERQGKMRCISGKRYRVSFGLRREISEKKIQAPYYVLG